MAVQGSTLRTTRRDSLQGPLPSDARSSTLPTSLFPDGEPLLEALFPHSLWPPDQGLHAGRGSRSYSAGGGAGTLLRPWPLQLAFPSWALSPASLHTPPCLSLGACPDLWATSANRLTTTLLLAPPELLTWERMKREGQASPAGERRRRRVPH